MPTDRQLLHWFTNSILILLCAVLGVCVAWGTNTSAGWPDLAPTRPLIGALIGGGIGFVLGKVTNL
jgi:hypothetical protein